MSIRDEIRAINERLNKVESAASVQCALALGLSAFIGTLIHVLREDGKISETHMTTLFSQATDTTKELNFGESAIEQITAIKALVSYLKASQAIAR